MSSVDEAIRRQTALAPERLALVPGSRRCSRW